MTGGPGSGKTTQLEALEKLIISQNLQQKWIMHPEVSRELQEQKDPITKERIFNPATDPNTFTQAILRHRIQDYNNAIHNAINIYDRGLIDSLAYCRAYECPGQEQLIELCQANQYDLVLFFPFWEDIYVQDTGRCENNQQALFISNKIKETLILLNINYQSVPTGSIEHRTDFLVSTIQGLL